MMKKLFRMALLLLLVAAVVVAWYGFQPRWRTIAGKHAPWGHVIVKKGVVDLETVARWEPTTEEVPFDTGHYVLLRTTFQVERLSQMQQLAFVFDNKYSAEVFLNGVPIADVDRFAILPSSAHQRPTNILFHEYWRKRRIIFDPDQGCDCLTEGANEVVFVIRDMSGNQRLKSERFRVEALQAGFSLSTDLLRQWRRGRFEFSRSSLPILIIETHGEVIPDEPKIEADMRIIDNGGRNDLADPGAEHKVLLERRGTTSQKGAKRSYTLQLAGDTTMFGMQSSDKWVLYGPYVDKSLIRNALVYELFRQMGGHAPLSCYLELVINNNYRGIYMLVEKLPLKRALAENGYLIEVDRDGERSKFPPDGDTAHERLYYELHSPRAWRMDTSTWSIVQQQFHHFEESLYHRQGFYEKLEMNSFVDHMILTEFTKNIDGYRLSTFLHHPNISDPEARYEMGPIWDYNFSLGLTFIRDGHLSEGLVHEEVSVPFWWEWLMNDPQFSGRLNERYRELRGTVLSQENIHGVIDSLVAIIRPSLENNFNKWQGLGAKEFWPNYFIGKSHQEEIMYLKQWMDQRMVYLDRILQYKAERQRVRPVGAKPEKPFHQ